MFERCGSVFDSLSAFGFGAVGAAVEVVSDFYAVADDTTAAVFAGWGQFGHGALEAVENVVFVSAGDDLEGLVIFIATLLTLRHIFPPLCALLARSDDPKSALVQP